MMITVSENQGIVVSTSKAEYSLEDEKQYKDFLLVLTDPDPDSAIIAEDVEIDSNLTDSDSIELAIRYSDFLKEFLSDREVLLAQNRDKLEAQLEELDQLEPYAE